VIDNSFDSFPSSYWFLRLPEIKRLPDGVREIISRFMRMGLVRSPMLRMMRHVLQDESLVKTVLEDLSTRTAPNYMDVSDTMNHPHTLDLVTQAKPGILRCVGVRAGGHVYAPGLGPLNSTSMVSLLLTLLNHVYGEGDEQKLEVYSRVINHMEEIFVYPPAEGLEKPLVLQLGRMTRLDDDTAHRILKSFLAAFTERYRVRLATSLRTDPSRLPSWY
jgi:hypothetical protein